MSDTVDSGPVFASHHCFWLMERNAPMPAPLSRSENGLISSQPGSAQIWTGVHTGNVFVTVEVRSSPPDEPQSAEWPDVAEVDLYSTHGAVQVSSLMAHLERELPVLTQDGAGRYRVRVCGRGRDQGEFSIPASPEEYLILTWPIEEQSSTTPTVPGS
jgi:hypothetical protein